MKKSFRIIAVLLVCVLSVALVLPTFATEDDTQQNNILGAEITKVKNGANGIVTWTFDDGLKDQAELVKEICKKYGAKATLMLMGTNADTTSEMDYWKALLADGTLEAQCHAWVGTPGQDLTSESDIKLAVETSKETLSPLGDILVYAAPSSNVSVETFPSLRRNYYAVRMGSQLANNQLQSVDPSITPDGATRGEHGSWQNLAVICPAASYHPFAELKGLVTSAAENGGWFISLHHKLVSSNPDDNQVEVTAENFEELVKHTAELRDAGKIWIATFGEATKYIRERQNTTVNVSGNTVSLTMAETTADGLALDPEVFDMALTVKINVPTYWNSFDIVREDGTRESITTKREGGLNFGYVDILPGESVTVENGIDISDIIGGIKQSIAVDESIVYNLYIPKERPVSKVMLYDAETNNDLGVEVIGVEEGEYLKYTARPLYIDEIDHVYTYEVIFEEQYGIDPIPYSISGISYLNSLLSDANATATEKQLGYDFALYALESFNFFNADIFKMYPSNNDTTPQDVKTLYARRNLYSTVVDSYRAKGFNSFDTSSASAVMEGTIGKAIRGAAFTLNEKPYYLLYLKAGFTGTVTVEYTGVDGELHTESFVAKNGHYNLREYIVFEVESVYDLAQTLNISASGYIYGGASSVEASGSYSIVNYCKANNNSFGKAFLAYVMSANAYASAKNG